MRDKLDPGEVDKMIDRLPAKLRELWDSSVDVTIESLYRRKVADPIPNGTRIWPPDSLV